MSSATWKQVITRIESHPLDSPQWLSNKKHLLDIVDQAQEWDFDPAIFMEPSISNLRTIIRTAREAVAAENSYWLRDILRWANTLTLAELRLRLGTTIPTQIPISQISDGEEEKYNVTLTADQVHQIQKSMKLMYQFSGPNIGQPSH